MVSQSLSYLESYGYYRYVMEKGEIENIETELLLEAIFKRYGHDFRNYARTSIKRRLQQAMIKFGCASIMEMGRELLYDPAFFHRLLAQLSITVTEMFRDPQVYRTIREEIVPYLATYPFIKIWHRVPPIIIIDCWFRIPLSYIIMFFIMT